MKYKISIVALMVVCLTLFAMLSTGPLRTVSAVDCGTKAVYFRGAMRTSDNRVTGAQAHVTALPRYTCPNSDTTSSWVMVQNFTSGRYSAFKYMQSGVYRLCPGQYCTGTWFFSEWRRTNAENPHIRMWPYEKTFGQTYNFKVERKLVGYNYIWYMTWNALGGTKHPINSVQNSDVNFTKDQARYSGETHWSASYMPGYSSRRVYFDRLRWRTTQWYSPSITCNSQGSNSNYHESCSNGVNGFSIWDSR